MPGGVRPLPVLWICDSSSRWHATRTNHVSPSRNSGEVMLWLQIVPPAAEVSAAALPMVRRLRAAISLRQYPRR